MRDVTYCNECGARLNLYVVGVCSRCNFDGVCSRCNFDLTGEDVERDAREARDGLRGSESPREGTEA
jgi:hypothetical protein